MKFLPKNQQKKNQKMLKVRLQGTSNLSHKSANYINTVTSVNQWRLFCTTKFKSPFRRMALLKPITKDLSSATKTDLSYVLENFTDGLRKESELIKQELQKDGELQLMDEVDKIVSGIQINLKFEIYFIRTRKG
jgi:hypothetical protein